jgi:hypothetical protein
MGQGGLLGARDFLGGSHTGLTLRSQPLPATGIKTITVFGAIMVASYK